MTVGFGLIAITIMPDFPEKAQNWFLKPHERQYLVAKLEASRGFEDKGSAIDDVSTWKVCTSVSSVMPPNHSTDILVRSSSTGGSTSSPYVSSVATSLPHPSPPS